MRVKTAIVTCPRSFLIRKIFIIQTGLFNIVLIAWIVLIYSRDLNSATKLIIPGEVTNPPFVILSETAPRFGSVLTALIPKTHLCAGICGTKNIAFAINST